MCKTSFHLDINSDCTLEIIWKKKKTPSLTSYNHQVNNSYINLRHGTRNERNDIEP
jgi:hypothetical protein